jgi:hypothetical protein
MKMKKQILFAALLMIVIASQLFLVRADGGYFPHPGYWVRPGEQRAIIFHEENTETLILTSGFQGNAKDLVWLVPTPTKPEVTKANEQIFTNIAKLATPQRTYAYSYGGMLEASKGAVTAGVVVIESKQVDYYDVNVLLATSSQDLVKWFNENNYYYPEQYSYVLNYYIEKGWYFTAIKVSPESQGATEVMQALKEGHPTPIKMVFLSEKIVFPLKISSVDLKPEIKYGPAQDELVGATRQDKYGDTWTKKTSDINLANWCRSYAGGGESCVANYYIDELPGGINYEESYYRYSDYIPIQLYVVADGKYEADNFYINYANWVKAKDIKNLGVDENGNAMIQPKKSKYFLTSLSASYQKSQMDDDIYLKKAEDNKKVNAGPETWQLFVYGLLIGLLLSVTWIFSPLGILFIAGCLILFFAANRKARIFGWIMEIFSFAVTFILGLVFIIIAAMNNSLGNYAATSVIITYVLFLAIMVLLMILQVRYKRK